jgi:hypothetical protein
MDPMRAPRRRRNLTAVAMILALAYPETGEAQQKTTESSSDRADSDIDSVAYQKAIEIPAAGAEQIEVINRLGSVTISGWDRPAVGVTATKQAPSAQLGERLRVQVSSRNGRQIEVRTYVRVQRAIPAPMRKELRALMAQQLAVLEAMLRRRISIARAEQKLQKIRAELDGLALRFADVTQPKASELSVPLAKQGRLDLRLQIPRHLHIKARTFKDKLTVVGCRGGARLSSEEGRVAVERTRGKVVTWTQKGAQRLVKVRGAVEVGGGVVDVELAEVSGPVRASVLSGTIDIRRLGARFATVRLIGGTIRVGGVPLGGRYTTISRDADVRVDTSSRGAFRLRSPAAAVEPDAKKRLRGLQDDGERLRGSYGKRGGVLNVSTRGSVRFE